MQLLLFFFPQNYHVLPSATQQEAKKDKPSLNQGLFFPSDSESDDYDDLSDDNESEAHVVDGKQCAYPPIDFDTVGENDQNSTVEQNEQNSKTIHAKKYLQNIVRCIMIRCMFERILFILCLSESCSLSLSPSPYNLQLHFFSVCIFESLCYVVTNNRYICLIFSSER